MSNTRSSSGKLSIFVTRRWPQAAEAALGEHFDVTLNDGDKPLSRDALIDGFASHDIAAPTVSDTIDAEIVAAGAAVLSARSGIETRVGGDLLTNLLSAGR